MCRIAVLPPDYKGAKIMKLLDHLEKAQGGAGNGFGWFDSEGIGQIQKGVKLKNETLNEITPAESMILYHTRVASAGDINDSNTQPFFTLDGKKNRVIMCHNGTWSAHSDYKKILLMAGSITVKEYKEWSDTRLMAWLMEHQGADRLALPDTGVWVLHYGKYSIVHVKSGDFSAYKLGKKWVYASEFPKDDYKEVWDFQSDSIVMITADKGFKTLVGKKPILVKNEAYSYTNSTWKNNRKVWGVKSYVYNQKGERIPLDDYVDNTIASRFGAYGD